MLSSLALAMLSCLPLAAAADGRMFASTGGTIPLVAEEISVHIDHQLARSHIEQRFENPWHARVEGQYDLVLGRGAIVSAFAYWNGTEKIVGEVFEKSTARTVYLSVTGRGRDPGLLEWIDDGSYRYRVFPIEPREIKRVAIDVEQWLARRADTIELRLPVHHQAAQLTVTIQDPRPVHSVSSPTHELELQRQSQNAVRVRATGTGPDALFVLRYRVTDQPGRIVSSVHRDPDQPAFVVMTLPAIDSNESGPRDVTLVIDRSGSMGGEPLEIARRTARELVDRLKEDDRINIMTFSKRPDALYPMPQKLTDEVRAQARAYLSAMYLGGTGSQFDSAVRHALRRQIRDEQPDFVLFVSDGQSVSGLQATETALADTSRARIFTLGVGHAPDRGLLSRLARAKGGRLLLGSEAAGVDSGADELLRLLDATPLEDLRIETKGAELGSMVPAALPDLFGGDELRVVGKLTGTDTTTIVVHGRQNGAAPSFETTLQLPDRAHRPWLGRLWAKARVDELEDQMALAKDKQPLRKEIVELALAYGLVTPYTSMLAIPESELTEWSRRRLALARERRENLFEAHPEAAGISRSRMPPGDPILRVKASRDALHVTAYFPFGLVEELHYDPHNHDWRTRFLVPKDVADGRYDVRILVTLPNGQIQCMTVSYVIDSAVSDFDVATEVGSGRVFVRVFVHEPAREVRIAAVGLQSVPATVLQDNGSGQLFEGARLLPPGRHQLRIVVADDALNERVRIVEVEVPE